MVFLLASCQLGRYVFYNFADIRDYRKFPDRTLEEAPSPFMFQTANPGRFPKAITSGAQDIPFDTYLEDNETVAFLIIRNDSIQYERYFQGYEAADIVPSFSMAKSVTSILIR
ncbi:MAG: serine hydrolase, partial [Bacteroidetes bacterium]